MGLRDRIKTSIKIALGVGGNAAAGSRAPERAANPVKDFGPAARPVAEAQDASTADTMSRLECGAQELKERLDAGEPVVILDVRTAPELASGMLPGARHIPLQELEARWEELKGADEIVCYCAAGMRSAQAARLLRQKGLINATSMEGGLPAWTAIGGAVKAP